MVGEYKAACGCAIHVAQWAARRKVVTQQSCPLHKAAPDLLKALKSLLDALGALSNPSELCGMGLNEAEQNEILTAIAKAEGR